MSWSISLAAKGKDAAKYALREKAADCPTMPDSITAMCEAAIDALPETGMPGHDTISLASYGHFRPADGHPQVSNFTLAAQYVADGPE